MTETDRGTAQRKSESAPSDAPRAEAVTFASTGEYWTVGYGGTTFLLRDVKGLSYIQRLLQHPGEEFHALDLLSGPGGGAASEEGVSWVSDAGVTVGGPGDAGEMLDPQAKQDYKRRLIELREELEDLRERGEHARVAEIESEIGFLAREIARAVGLGGRSRRAGSTAERARLNVTRAIKLALQKISEHHAQLGELLARSVRTGTFCSYIPDSRAPISWRFALEGVKPAVEPETTPPFFLRHETSLLRALADRTKFVGREGERSTLRRSLEQALRGEGRVVIIGGAPGVGKTRIAAEFGEEASQRGVQMLAGACYDRDHPLPFVPFVEILEALLAQAPNPRTFRVALGNDAAEIARLLPQLRRLFPDIPPPLDLPPEQSRRILFNAVADLLARTSATGPVLLVLEDLHWADEGTLSLLDCLARSVSKMPVMIVATYRDDELDPAGRLSKTLDELVRLHVVDRIGLRGLPQTAVADMIGALSGRGPPEAIVSFIYSNTEGNPFFIEELVRHLLERGQLTDSSGEFRRDLKLVDIDIPQSLRRVIGRRLARLSEGTQKVLGTAAVIGRSFTFEPLEAAAHMDADSLLDHVEEVEKAGLISSSLDYPDARFRFSHELIRQTVISGLSAPRRQRLHLDVANAIERLYPNALEDRASDLAYHLWSAGAAASPDKTVRYLAVAARREREQSAYDSACRHLETALELLKKLPDSADRARRELDLQIDYGLALLAMRGWYAPEVGNAYRRARELCQGLGEDSRLFSVLFGLWGFHLSAGEHRMARSHADEMTRLAQGARDDGLLVQACWALGCSRFFMGEFSDAHASFEEAIRRYDRKRHLTLTPLIGQDPCMSSFVYDANTLWILGYPEQADKRAQESRALARELGYPFTLVSCLNDLAIYRTLRGDYAQAESLIDEGLALSKEHGFAQYELSNLAYREIALGFQQKFEKLKTGPRAPRFTEAEDGRALISVTYIASALAESFGQSGKIATALGLLARAAEFSTRNQERYVDSEIRRIKGELRLKQIATCPRAGGEIRATESEAEQNFLAAIEIARRQGAKAFQLRAATSLSRLYQRWGRREEARRVLAEIYDSFAEGFETPDLQEAHALLVELAEPRE